MRGQTNDRRTLAFGAGSSSPYSRLDSRVQNCKSRQGSDRRTKAIRRSAGPDFDSGIDGRREVSTSDMFVLLCYSTVLQREKF